jgi:agmatinase
MARMTFDPDAAASPDSGVFGLPHTREDARVVLIPAPFDATTSYGNGTSRGPAAILEASRQVDLHDTQFGPIYEQGVFMASIDETITKASARARKLAEGIIMRGGATEKDERAVAEIETACAAVNEFVRTAVDRCLDNNKIPGVIGGEHGVSLGALRACAERLGDKPMGVLQIDAHMDLRVAFEGFEFSHASIMHNALARIPTLGPLVQIGLRDVGRAEVEASTESGGRVRSHFDLDWRRLLDGGESFLSLVERAIEPLPADIYISFDIDGLDPALCPNTGTPVPGGLTFSEACLLLQAVAESGRRVIGFDLCEVCPPEGELDSWDANVGARILYKLCGAAIWSQQG